MQPLPGILPDLTHQCLVAFKDGGQIIVMADGLVGDRHAVMLFQRQHDGQMAHAVPVGMSSQAAVLTQRGGRAIQGFRDQGKGRGD